MFDSSISDGGAETVVSGASADKRGWSFPDRRGLIAIMAKP
jgi:hypothetical protein